MQNLIDLFENLCVQLYANQENNQRKHSKSTKESKILLLGLMISKYACSYQSNISCLPH
jgi:hypothetical protein